MFHFDRRSGLSLAFTAIACLAAGCHKKDSVPLVVATASPVASPSASASAVPTDAPSPSPSPSPTLMPASAMTTFNVEPQGGSVSLSSAGYGGALSYPGNSATTASGSFTISTMLNGAIPAPAPSGNPFLYFTMQLSNTVSFVGNFAVTPVTLPTSISTTGATYVESLYDQTMGVQVGTPVTGIVSGQTITFGSVTGGSFNATAGDVYLFVISSN